MVGRLAAGPTVLAISKFFGCTKKTIRKLVRRFRQTGSVRERPRSCRSHVTEVQTDGTTSTHLRCRFPPATATARCYDITSQTVRVRLKSRNRPIRAYRPDYGQILTRTHWAARKNRKLMLIPVNPTFTIYNAVIKGIHHMDLLTWCESAKYYLWLLTRHFCKLFRDDLHSNTFLNILAKYYMNNMGGFAVK